MPFFAQGDVMTDSNARFTGSIPAAYHKFLGPFFFQPYAEDLAARVVARAPRDVLEVACGTGIVTAMLGTCTAAGHDGRDRPERRDDRLRPRGGTGQAAALVAPGRCLRPSVRGRTVRRRRLPVRPDVRARQAAGHEGSAARAASRWLAPVQRVGFACDANPSAEITRDTINRLFPDNPTDLLRRAVRPSRPERASTAGWRRRVSRTSRSRR